MAMKIGSKQIPSDFKGRLRMKDMQIGEKWVVHIVNGPVKRVTQLWPTVEEDRQTQVMKPTWRSVYVKKDDANILDKLAALDIQLKRKHAVMTKQMDEKTAAKEYRKSAIGKSERYDYAVIRHNTGEPLKVEIMETVWTVHDAIMSAKNASHPTNPTMLQYGLPYMYLFVIEKRSDPKTKQNDYIVSPLNVMTEGRIPKQYLDEAKYPFDHPEQFFTPDELAAIATCDWDIDAIDLPISADEVAAKVAEWPIDLSRSEWKKPDTFMLFKSREDLGALISFAHANQIHITLPSDQDMLRLTASGSVPQPQEQTHTALPPGGAGNMAISDASYTVIPNDPAPVPASGAFVAPGQLGPTPVITPPGQPAVNPFVPVVNTPFSPPAGNMSAPLEAPPVATAVPPVRPPEQTQVPPVEQPIGNTPTGAATFKKPNIW